MKTQEQWQLTLEAAELYERCPARYILGPWAPLLVDVANLAQSERVLDVACGTGVVARIAAKRVGPTGRVVGIDLNPGMIAVAQSLAAPVGTRIEWIERSALDLRLEDASFDAVLCQQGLQFFPNKLVALKRCAAYSTVAAVSRLAYGTAPGFIPMWSVTRLLDLWATKLLSVLMLLGRFLRQRTCDLSQGRLAFQV